MTASDKRNHISAERSPRSMIALLAFAISACIFAEARAGDSQARALAGLRQAEEYAAKIGTPYAQGCAYARIAAAAAHVDVGFARRMAALIKDPWEAASALSQIARVMAHSNRESAASLFEEAIAVANRISNTFQRGHQLTLIARELLPVDLKRALEIIDDDANLETEAEVVGKAMLIDVDAALAWIDRTRPDNPNNLALMESVVEGLAQDNPEAALAAASQASSALRGTLEAARKSSPVYADRMERELTAMPFRPAIFVSLARQDPAAAASRLEKMVAGIRGNQNVRSFLEDRIDAVRSALAPLVSDPIGLAQAVKNPELRLDTIYDGAAALANTAPERAAAIMKEHADRRRTEAAILAIVNFNPLPSHARQWAGEVQSDFRRREVNAALERRTQETATGQADEMAAGDNLEMKVAALVNDAVTALDVSPAPARARRIDGPDPLRRRVEVLSPAASEPERAQETAADVHILSAKPDLIIASIGPKFRGKTLRVILDVGSHSPGRFIWENIKADGNGRIILRDDKYLQTSLRLQGYKNPEARLCTYDPTLPTPREMGFNCNATLPTFGSPTFILSWTASQLARDPQANFWVLLSGGRLRKYDSQFNYLYTLVSSLSGNILHIDFDGQGNLYALLPNRLIAKYSNSGVFLGVWEFSSGIEPGEVMNPSSMVLDRTRGFMYVADSELHRVQRYDLEFAYCPFRFNSYGWLGLEDLSYVHAESWSSTAPLRLDRPMALAPDGGDNILVQSHHYISRFSLLTGDLVPFGDYPVLGWGGSFHESSHSPNAAKPGHWEWVMLLGADSKNHVYAADFNTHLGEPNSFLQSRRVQEFDKNGNLVNILDCQLRITDKDGNAIVIQNVKTLAASGPAAKEDADKIWVIDGCGRVYESVGLASGGRSFLGPGGDKNNSQERFDLTTVRDRDFTVLERAGARKEATEGILQSSQSPDQRGGREASAETLIPDGGLSAWTCSRLGEPFIVFLFENKQRMKAEDYLVTYQTCPGTSGNANDYFRVKNISGRTWRGVSFRAEVSSFGGIPPSSLKR